MVDFNNESIIGQSPTEILKLILLEKLDYCIEALKEVYQYHYKNQTWNLYVFRSGLQALFWSVKPMLFNSIGASDKINNYFNVDKVDSEPITKEVYKKLEKQINSEQLAEQEQALEFLLQYLYYKGLLKIDSRRQYDWSSPEAVNIEKGL